MWKIKQLIFIILLSGSAFSVRSHPVSVMQGDAVWAQNELIMNMQMSMDNLMLHFQLPVDGQGYLSKNQLKRSIRDFEKLLESGFKVSDPEAVAPTVSFSAFPNTFPAKLKRYALRDYKLAFEIRFRCTNPSSKITLIQTMGDRSRGLQSTSLVNFHFGGTPQLIPLYNDVPIVIDLENHRVVHEKNRLVMQLVNKKIGIHLPPAWTAGEFPFELTVGDVKISGVQKTGQGENDIWPEYIFNLPEDATAVNITWISFSWQLRRIDLIVKKANEEQTVILSRFRPGCSIDVQ